MLKRLKQLVRARAEGRCEYCVSREDFCPDSFVVDHIVPSAKGGDDDLDNLAFACQGCNNRKYTHQEGIDPVSGQSVPLFHPRKDAWPQHFSWSQDALLSIGETPTGRATVEQLQLNRPGVVNLRKAMIILGLHPPT